MKLSQENPNLNEEFKKKYYPDGKLNKDLMNEEDSDNKSVSTFQYYFEAIITIILFFHSFFIYSYLNIIHVVYCFLLTYSRYDIDYTFHIYLLFGNVT